MRAIVVTPGTSRTSAATTPAAAPPPAAVPAAAILAAAILAAACSDNLTPAPAPDDDRPLCFPDLDGRITAAELPIAPVTGPAAGPARAATYAIAAGPRQVDLAGHVDAEGRRVWDWSVAAPGETRVAIAPAPLVAQWYAAEFPDGELVIPLDVDGTLHGVYSADDLAVRLHGIASSDPDPPAGRTLLPYTAPVAVYRFPLEPGAAWNEVGVIASGTLLGLPYVGEDRYEISVDAAGELALPELSFTQALRVRVRVEHRPALGGATSRRQVSFLFECFGEVGRAVSAPDETALDFTVADEVRRFTVEEP
jgi:hypothetical protein